MQARRDIFSRAVVDEVYRGQLQKNPTGAIEGLGFNRTQAREIAGGMPNVGRFVNLLDTHASGNAAIILCGGSNC